MRYAMSLAQRAQSENEVPVGAVLVLDEQIIGEGWNRSITTHDPTAHAEVMALRNAGQQLQNYRLCDTTLYVTLEPCAMCVGALIHARIKRLVFGAYDLKAGAIVSAMSLHEQPHFNHRFDWQAGVLQEECSAMMSRFFKARRDEIKNAKGSVTST